MTLTSILKRLNQSTPFDEAQFIGLLQDILGWSTVAIARENLPVHLHEATEEFSRLYTSKPSTMYVWLLKLKYQNPITEEALLDFIAQKESECMVVIRYPDIKNWKLGLLSLIDGQAHYKWMDIGNQYTNNTWGQVLFNHQHSTKSLRALKSCFQQIHLQSILLSRVKYWKKYTLNTLHHSSGAGSFNGSLDLCIELFLQVLVLTIIEKKGWLGVSEKNDWGAGPQDFLLTEWNRVNPRGENYWLSVLRPLLLATDSNTTLSSRYKDIHLPALNLHITKNITDFAIPNSIFWDPQHGLLSLLYAFPIDLSSTNPHSILHINESDLRAVLEDVLSRGGKSEYKGYHTPSVLGETLNRQALEAYLLSQIRTSESISDGSALSQAVSLWIQTGQISEQVKLHAHRLSQWLQTVQICDPAMGAGALLVSMMQLITTLCCELDGTQKAHKLKFSLLQKTLFGVDTSALSLSCAKISLWLCWVKERRHPKPFPNLEGNIIQANSIVDEPFEAALWNESSLPLELSTSDIESPFAQSIIALRNGLMHDLKAYPLSNQPALRLSEIADKQWKLSLLHAEKPLTSADVQTLKDVPEMACIWPWRFPNVFIHERSGFDIVVCNPPFMSEETNRDLFLNLKAKSSLREWYNGRMDLLYYFVFRSIQIAKTDGIVSLMTNDFWTKATGAQRLRQYLKSSLHLTHWIHFGEFNDVEVASRQHNLLLSFCKTPPKEDDQTFVYSINFKRNVLDWLTANEYIRYVRTSTDLLYHSSQVTMQFVDEKEWGNILDKICHHHAPLNKLASLHQGLVTGANQSADENDPNKRRGIFVLQADNEYDARMIQQLKKEAPSILKPLRKNSEIKSFTVETAVERYVLYLYRGLDISAETHPTLMTHLRPFYERLRNRREVHKGSIDWWCLSWPRTEKIFSASTIVTPYRSTTFRFSQNKHGYHYSSDCTMIVPNEAQIHPSYLLGYLNSTVFECWYRLKGKNKGALLEFLTSPLQEVPIPLCSQRSVDEIATIVRSIEGKVSSSSDPDPLSGHIKAIDSILFRELNLSLSEQRRVYKYVNLFSKVT